MTTRIARITGYDITHYSDNGQTFAHCSWTDTKGVKGVTVGDPTNGHMIALKERAIREGVTVTEIQA